MLVDGLTSKFSNTKYALIKHWLYIVSRLSNFGGVVWSVRINPGVLHS